MRHLLALDAGTGSGRAVLFDETGLELASATREWFHKEEPGYPNSMTFERDKNWSLLVSAIKEVLDKVRKHNIVAISTTSMREGIVVYAEDGGELWACANVDARAESQVKQLRALDANLESKAYRISGQTFALGAAPRLLWLKEHEPGIYEQIDKVAMLSDWVSTRLGAQIAVDPSNGGTTGLFDLKTRNWDLGLAKELGLNVDYLSTPVFESGTQIGEVSLTAGQETGLKAGTAIVMGGGDAQLGTVGVAAVNAGDTAVFGGSFWQQEVNLSKPLYDSSEQIRMNFNAIPNMWQAEAIVFFPGIAARWFRDYFAPDIKERALKSGKDPYELLEDLASQVPAGSYGVIPIFSDAMDYMHWKHAAPSFLNMSLDPDKSGRGVLFRALQENAAIVTLANLKRIERISGKFPTEIIFASGAAKGKLWPQILADVLQIQVKTPVVKEATALGAAIAAGVGVGVYHSMAEAAQRIVRWDKVFIPNSNNARIYQETYERWQASYAPQLELANRGITNYLWKAPGE